MSEFKMPALGADMEAGTLVEWLVKPGDMVVPGAVVAVVETQKGAIEVEIFQQGTVGEILVPVGQRVPVGTVLARIEGEAPAGAPAVAPMMPAPAVAPETRPVPAPAAPPAAPTDRIRATPVARRRAAELGVELRRLTGTGTGGAIRLADVEAFEASRVAPTRKERGFVITEMRQAIAVAMTRAKREIPHYYLSETLDLSNALGWLERFNATQPPDGRLLPAVLFLKASALAFQQVPELNGTFVDGKFIGGDGVHIGWATSLRSGGLVAPAIRDADRKSLVDTMAAMRDLVQRARSGGLRSSELSSPTVTITSLGDRGAEAVTAIIYPPQVAIIGFGRISMRPSVANGKVEARPLVTATLAADHRVTDGHKGGLFLAALRDHLQEPEKL